MATNDYHFITRWRVQGTVDEVAAIIGNAADLVRWWPSVYLEVEELEPGDAQGVGQAVRLYTKGWLPYTLRWQFRVVEANPPHGWTIEASGDFNGRGSWIFAQDGAWVNITFDWKIRADKPLLRALSVVLKPIFAANHRWAMAQGQTSLRLELARRHAETVEARARVPLPPAPTSSSPLPLLAGSTAATILIVLLVRRLLHSSSVSANRTRQGLGVPRGAYPRTTPASGSRSMDRPRGENAQAA